METIDESEEGGIDLMQKRFKRSLSTPTFSSPLVRIPSFLHASTRALECIISSWVRFHPPTHHNYHWKHILSNLWFDHIFNLFRKILCMLSWYLIFWCMLNGKYECILWAKDGSHFKLTFSLVPLRNSLADLICQRKIRISKLTSDRLMSSCASVG